MPEMEQPKPSKNEMEEEYSFPPDASVPPLPVSTGNPSSGAQSESFYSEPIRSTNSSNGSILNHHPASPFERVVKRSTPGGSGSTNGSHGAICLPDNCNSEALSQRPRLKPVQTVGSVAAAHWPPVDPGLDLAEQLWFHPGPEVDRHFAERLLRPHPEGAFLVRCCQGDGSIEQQQQYSLSLRARHGHQCVHMRIERTPQGHYVLGQYSQPFASVPQMIRHYAEHVLPIRGLDRIILGLPVCRSDNPGGRGDI